MTGGDESWGGFHPLFSSLFCLVLISYLSIYLSYLLLYLSVHNHFLTVLCSSLHHLSICWLPWRVLASTGPVLRSTRIFSGTMVL